MTMDADGTSLTRDDIIDDVWVLDDDKLERSSDALA